MGIAVGIMGASGSGKSTSLRNYEPQDRIVIFEVAGKVLPFRSTQLKPYIINTDNYEKIKSTIDRSIAKNYRTFVIDDSQYLMAFANFAKANEKGYDKYVQMAKDFEQLLVYIKNLPEDVIVFLLHHTDTDDRGVIKLKTLGKMLDNQLTLDGMFTILLQAVRVQGAYRFQTQDTEGVSTVKTPMGMFDSVYIDNDLRLVENTIREYYDIPKVVRKAKQTTEDETTEKDIESEN